ncbi:hypothetical protein GCM10011400_03800 [Paraburkholderia caffeinilytica]|uniref:Uncharacterized protein n=1 Tax=Paraburkholderia caffeinilytica TaxID=1761016 RepID=A0ABQ1L8L2_9BURK|nr:hypothetical protein GCM10011400_03800 [Paraburkholderia caffeinilytica]
MKKVEAAGRDRSGRPTPAFATFYVHHAPRGPPTAATHRRIKESFNGRSQPLPPPSAQAAPFEHRDDVDVRRCARSGR